jgi:hypothetical protein
VPLSGELRAQLASLPTEDPSLMAYRQAGVPDDAVPRTATEAQRWRSLAEKSCFAARDQLGRHLAPSMPQWIDPRTPRLTSEALPWFFQRPLLRPIAG